MTQIWIKFGETLYLLKINHHVWNQDYLFLLIFLLKFNLNLNVQNQDTRLLSGSHIQFLA